MIKWIFQDVKRTLKSRKTYLLLTVMIISIIFYLFSSYKKFNTEPLDEYGRYDPSLHAELAGFDPILSIQSMAQTFDYECLMAVNLQKPLDETSVDCSSYETFLDLFAQAETEYRVGMSEGESIDKYYELMLHTLNIGTDNYIKYFDESNAEMQKVLLEKSVDIELIRELKANITEDLKGKYPSFKLTDNERSISTFNARALALYETYISYKANYPLEIKQSITGSFFLANYLNDFFLLLVSITIILVFDSYYRDYHSGVIKTILSTPSKRFKYAFMKTMSAMISIVIVIFTPLLLTMIILYFINGFDSFDYPIYISRSTTNSFNPVLIYSKIISAEKSSSLYSTYTNICSVAPVSKFTGDITSAGIGVKYSCLDMFSFANITALSLSKYITMVIAYLLLITVFIASLNTLLSLIFNNQILNLISLALILILSLVLTQTFIGNPILKVLPFTFISPTALLMGTVPYTFLNGIVTISIWTVGLNITNYIVIKKIDFKY